MKRFFPFFILLGVACFFFYQSLLFGKIPFPGDLLVSEYAPWKYEPFLGFNPGSFPNKAQYFDVLQQLYPWRELAVSEIKQGRVPLWNPYSFSGYPLFANIQSAVLNPVNIFFFFLPFAGAWTVTVMLQCFLASLGMYLLLRKFKLHIVSSFFGSFAYSYSIFMTVFLEYNTIGYVVALLPLCAFFCLRVKEKQTFLNLVTYTFLLSLLFLVGHLQLAVVAFIFLLVFSFASLEKRRNSREMLQLLFPFIFSILIASIQLFPSFELISLSARVPQDYAFLTSKLLIQPWQLIMSVMPDIFGNPATRNFIPNQTYPTKALSVGVATLLFTFLAIWQLREKRETRFFTGAGCILFLILTLNPLSGLFYKIQIPLFSTSSPSNMIFLLSFCLSVLAAFGLEVWIGKTVSKKIVLIFLSAITLFFVLSLPQKQYFQYKNIFFSTAIVVSVVFFFLLGEIKKSLKKVIVILFIAGLLGEQFFFFQKFNPFVPATTIYPGSSIIEKLQELSASGERIWSFGAGVFEPNISVSMRIASPEGYDPLYPSYYGQLLAASKDGVIPQSFDASTRSNARIAPLSKKMAQEAAQFRLLDVLSVRYVVDRAENGSTEDTFPVTRFTPVVREGGWTVYENKEALPTAWIASSYGIASSTKSFQDQFFSQSFPYSQKVLLADIPGIDREMRQGKVVQFVSLPGKMLFKTVSVGDAILVLSQTYYPGWHVLVDGQEKQLLRVDHALSGVAIPKGEHDVAFYYWPRSFVFGGALTIISSVGLLLTAFFLQRRNV